MGNSHLQLFYRRYYEKFHSIHSIFLIVGTFTKSQISDNFRATFPHDCSCVLGSYIRDSNFIAGCEIFIKGTQHYGMATHTFESSTTEIGFIMQKSSWEQRLYKECTLHQESQYWDTTEWTNLFTDGREMSDFYLYNTDNGVLLKVLNLYFAKTIKSCY